MQATEFKLRVGNATVQGLCPQSFGFEVGGSRVEASGLRV